MERLLFSCLDEWAKKDGDRIALIEDNGSKKTYNQVKVFSDKIKALLLSNRIALGEKVLVLCKKSFVSIAAMLGIMKAGGCFVPYNLNKINANFLKFLTENQFTQVVIDVYALDILYKHKWFNNNITYYFLCNDVHMYKARYDISSLNLKWIEVYEGMAISNYNIKVTKDMLAYIIFTSGSTDNPKGVMISHESIVPVIKYRAESLEWMKDSTILSIAPQNFDMFIIELFCTFKSGAKILLKDKWRIIDELMMLIEKYHITNFITVPTLFSLIIKRKEKLRKYNISTLRGIGFGGGKCPVNLLKELDNFLQHQVQFYHGYGLTETACHALYYTIDDVQKIQTTTLPLGDAIPDTSIHVLDEYGKEVTEGSIGELVICGYNIMEGYYLNESETDKRLRKEKDDKGNLVKTLYTGDLVQRQNQHLYFVCRKDNQIKSAGHRIELDEIEVRIIKIANVLESAVIAVPDPEYENKIWCFVVLKDKNMTVQSLQKEINQKLEVYMRPHQIFLLKELPRNPNNKVDRQGLFKKYYTNGELK